MMKIVATNGVASRPPKRQGSPATTIARANLKFGQNRISNSLDIYDIDE